MAQLRYTDEGYPYYADDGESVPGDGTQLERVLPAVNPDDDAFTAAARRLYRSVFSPAREERAPKIVDLLAGGNPEVERFQTWPEKMVRSAVTLPYDAMMGRVPDTEAVMEPNALATFLGADPKSTWSVPAHESMIGRVQDLAGLAIGGPLTAPKGSATLRSGLERPDIGGGAVKQLPEGWRVEPNNGRISDQYSHVVVDPKYGEVHGFGSSPEAAAANFLDKNSLLAEIAFKQDAQQIVDKLGVKTPIDKVSAENVNFWEKTKQITPAEAQVIRKANNLPPMPPAPVFYSAVEHAVSNARQQSATPDQWLGFLRNQPGVKAEELQWMGLDDWLKNQKGSVRKEQIDEFVKNNKVEIKEVRKDGEQAPHEDDLHDRTMEIVGNYWEQQAPRTRRAHDDDIDVWLESRDGQRRYQQAVEQAESEVGGRDATKYSEYQLPGGENYRELLLTLPPKEVTSPDALGKQWYEAWTRRGGDPAWGELSPEKQRAFIEQARESGLKPEGETFRTSHWDEPNVLAHVRVNDRVIGVSQHSENPFLTVEGFKQIEKLGEQWNDRVREMQKSPEGWKVILEDTGTNAGFYVVRDEYGNMLARRKNSDEAMKVALINKNIHSVSRARMDADPQLQVIENQIRVVRDQSARDLARGARTLFLEEVQSDWHQAGRKSGYRGDQVPQWKVEATYKDGILLPAKEFVSKVEAEAFAKERGQQLVELRGSEQTRVPDAPFKTTWPDLVLKRMVREAAENGYDQIAWTPGEVQAARYDLSKQVDSIGVKPEGNNKHVVINAKSGVHASGVVDPNGKIVQGYDAFRDVVGKSLADVVGKEVADKILKSSGETKLEGVDLKVGGEGMKAFYDKMLVDKANALGKKFGAKVERQPLRTYEIVEMPEVVYTIGEPGWADAATAARMSKELPDSVGIYANGRRISNGPDRAGAEKIIEARKSNDSKIKFGIDTPDGGIEFPTRAEAEHWIKGQDSAWVMKITPKMREAAVGKGFPLFSAGLPFQFERVDHDPFATGYQSPLFRTEPVDHDPFGVLPYDPNRT